MKMISAFLFMLVGTMVSAQLTGTGECPEVHPISNDEKLPGTWYSVVSLLKEPGTAKCIQYTYTKEDGGLTVAAKFYDSVTKKVDGGKQTFETVETGVYKQGCEGCGPRKILAAEDDYMIIYSCSRNDKGEYYIFGRINTRVRNPSSETMKKAYEAAARNGLSADQFTTIDQSDCDTLID